MRPDHGATSISVGRFEQMGAADFFVFLRGESGDDQIALFIEQEVAVAVFHNERVAPTLGFAGGWLERFPGALAGLGLQATELAVTARSINVSLFQKRRAHDAVQAVGVLLTDLLALPDQRRFVR